MPNLAQLVSRIRTRLAGSNLARDAQLDALATEYAAAAQAVNQRLVLCQELLNRGLRCEAVHQAQLPPDILESLATLDFPERRSWNEIVGMYGLPEAPAPPEFGPAALNQAFAEQAALEPLISRLRRLSMEQGPVGERLQILHELTRRDPLNFVWTESIGEFERARLGELERDIHEAIRRKDLSALQSLERELSSGWVAESPPPVLVESVKKALHNFVYAEHLRQLETLAGELTVAFAARQTERIQEMLGRWNALTAQIQGNVPAALRAKVKPILAWRDKEDQRLAAGAEFETCLADLSATLDHSHTPESLRIKWKTLEEFRRAIPPELRDRYLAALDVQEKQRRRRVRNRGIMAGLACLAFVAALWGLMAWRGAESSFQSTVATLAGHIDAGNIDEAELLVKSLEKTDPATMARQEMVRQKLRLDKAKKMDAERNAYFASLLDDLRTNPAATEGSSIVLKAQKEARSAKERTAITQILTERRERAAAEQNKKDTAYDDECNRAELLLADAQKSVGTPGFSPAIAKAEDSVRQLDVMWKSTTPGMPVKHKKYQETIEILQKRDADRSAIKARSQQMADAFRAESVDVDGYLAALAALAEILPEKDLARDFLAAKKLESSWRAIAEWNASLDGKTPPDSVAYTAFLASADGRKHPDFATIKKLSETYQHDGVSLKKAYLAVFQHPLVRDLWKFHREPDLLDKAADPNWEYHTSDALLAAALNPQDKPRPFFRCEVIMDFALTGKRYLLNASSKVRAGQSALAEIVRAELDNLETLEPEAALKVFERLRDQPSIDPIAHLRLYRELINRTKEASPLMFGVLKEHNDALAGLKVDLAVPWMNPEDPRTQNSRPKAIEAVSKLPRFRATKARLTELLAAHRSAAARTKVAPVGFLLRTGGNWTITPRPANGITVAALIVNEEGHPAWAALGTTGGGGLLRSPPAAIPQGSIVFAVSSEK